MIARPTSLAKPALALILATATLFRVDVAAGQVAAGELRSQEYRVADYTGRKTLRVRILGEVKFPGVYHVPDGLTLLDATAHAGGLAPTAQGEVLVTGSHDPIHVENYLSPSAPSILLKEGDTIVYPSSWRADAPLYLQIVTAAVSVITLGLVLSAQR